MSFFFHRHLCPLSRSFLFKAFLQYHQCHVLLTIEKDLIFKVLQTSPSQREARFFLRRNHQFDHLKQKNAILVVWHPNWSWSLGKDVHEVVRWLMDVQALGFAPVVFIPTPANTSHLSTHGTSVASNYQIHNSSSYIASDYSLEKTSGFTDSRDDEYHHIASRSSFWMRWRRVLEETVSKAGGLAELMHVPCLSEDSQECHRLLSWATRLCRIPVVSPVAIDSRQCYRPISHLESVLRVIRSLNLELTGTYKQLRYVDILHL